MAGIVFKGEIYDLRKSNAWSSAAPKLGISYGSRNIYLMIKLPDNSDVIQINIERSCMIIVIL